MAELVRQLIEKVYCVKYTGLLRLRDLRNFNGTHRGWLLTLGLNCDERPLEIAFDGDDADFLIRLKKRLHQDHINDVSYYSGYKILHDPNLFRLYDNIHFIDKKDVPVPRMEFPKPPISFSPPSNLIPNTPNLSEILSPNVAPINSQYKSTERFITKEEFELLPYVDKSITYYIYEETT